MRCHLFKKWAGLIFVTATQDKNKVYNRITIFLKVAKSSNVFSSTFSVKTKGFLTKKICLKHPPKQIISDKIQSHYCRQSKMGSSCLVRFMSFGHDEISVECLF